MRYLAEAWRYTTTKDGHFAGMHGSSRSLCPSTCNPSIASRATRYSHAAEPVYHVQPPRPL
jgi:hypothetical protein